MIDMYSTRLNRLKAVHTMDSYVFKHTDYTGFPEESDEVFDLLLRKLIHKDLKKPFVILDGNIEAKIKPAFESAGSNMYIKYVCSFFGNQVNIKKFTIKKEEIPNYLNLEMDAKICIERFDEFTIDWSLNKMKGTKIKKSKRPVLDSKGIFSLEKVFDTKEISRNIFENCMGVGIKKVPNSAKLTFGRNNYFLGSNNVGKYVFILFDKGDTFFFDDEAKFIPLTQEGKRRDQVAKVESVKRKFTYHRTCVNTNLAKEYLFDLWLKSPNLIPSLGRKIYLKGKTKGIINGGGYFRFDHIDGSELKKGFYIGEKYAGSNTFLEWSGKNVLAKDLDGNILNAYELKSKGIETTGRKLLDNVEEAIYIRSLFNKRFYQVTFNGEKYNFSETDFDKFQRTVDFSDQKGFFMHLKKGEDPHCSFLYVNESGKLGFYEIFPTVK